MYTKENSQTHKKNVISVISHVRLFATPWTVPGSTVRGVHQAKILEWIPISFSRVSS